MKNAKAMALMLICGLTTTFSLSSCLDNDGGNNGGVIPTMTIADSIEACQKTAGNYTGKLYYVNPNKPYNDREDSVDVTWTISAETIKTNRLVMDNFPIKTLALYVANSGTVDKSKEVLEASASQKLTTDAIPYLKLSTQNSVFYQFNIKTKETRMEFDTEYDGNTHHVIVDFTERIQDSNGYYYYPLAQFYNNVFQGNICIEKVYVDGYEHRIANVFGIKAKKS